MNRLEQTILKNLIYNEEYTRKVVPFLQPDYFSDQVEKIVFREVHDFVNEYKAMPTHEALVINFTEKKNLTEEQVQGAIKLLKDLDDKKAEPTQTDWLVEQTEKFCQDKAIYNAIMDSVSILDDKTGKRAKGEIPQLLSDALGVSFDQNVGHDYTQDYESRYEFYHRTEKRIKTDLDLFNKITKGGFPNKTLNICLAGTGCHAKGTPILLYDGSIKNVEDVVIGDKLMGDDDTPRNVLSLVSGREMMYRLVLNSTKEETIVNENHILSLVNVNTGKIVNITVKEYLQKSKKYKHLHKSYYNKSIISFSEKNLSIDPYFMGLYLGDGHTHSVSLTTMDKEVVDYITEYVESKYDDCKIVVKVKPENRAKTYSFSFNEYEGFGNRINPIAKDFARYGLFFTQKENRTKCGSKFIPEIYKTSSVQQRLELLAGLIDSDGYKSSDGQYYFCSKSESLVDDVCYISKSLCFMTKKTSRIINGVSYYYTFIGTTLQSPQIIPCKIERKKTTIARKYNKNQLHTSFELECIGVDDYFGFSLDGNNLFCLGNFLVTHNTGKSLFMCHCSAAAISQGHNVLYITMEMAEEKIAERIDANLLNVTMDELHVIPREDYARKFSALKSKTHGKLIIKEYPTAAAHAGHFRALLQELKLKKNFSPEIIFIDYLNICASSRMKMGSSVNSYTYIKSIAEELRGLAVETGVPVVSATQTTRAGFCLDLESEVLTKIGVKKLKDVVVGDKIESNNGFNTVKNVFPIEKNQVYKIRTKSGKEIICSGKHKFPVGEHMIEKSIDDGLKIGEKLKIYK